MTRKEALTDLLAKVEAGEARGHFGKYCDALNIDAVDAMRAYRGSLDAAKALHEAVLPGWVVNIVAWFSLPSASVSVGNEEEVYDKDPARAWLIAIIKALIAMEDT